MRRDYFLCFFLLSIATSLLFVCLQPLYFTYDIIVPREFGLFEKFLSLLFAISVLVIIPIAAAIKRKFWITAGLSCYGILAYIPGFILPGMTDKISGSEAKLTSVIFAGFLKGLYGVVNAPFASLSKLFGDNFASSMAKKILPVAIISYIVVQLYRFYRDAYVKDKLSVKHVDPSIEQGEPTRANEPEEKDVLGTVVLAPAGEKKPVKVEAKESKKVTSETKALPKVDKESLKHDDVILLGAPSVSSETKPIKKVTEDDVIKLGPPKAMKEIASDTKPKTPEIIELGPPKKKEVIPENKVKTPDVIELGPPQVRKEAEPKLEEKPKEDIKKVSSNEGMNPEEINKMNQMFEEFIKNYENQTKTKIDNAQKQQLYSKFVVLYKQQNSGNK